MTQPQADYNWVMVIIDSCNNDYHFEGLDKLIELYHHRHHNEPLYNNLLEIRHAHWNTIHCPHPLKGGEISTHSLIN